MVRYRVPRCSRDYCATLLPYYSATAAVTMLTVSRPPVAGLKR